MTTTPTTDVAVVDPVFSDVEQYALAAFPAGYRGPENVNLLWPHRDTYALDLRQFMAWCQEHKVRLLAARRVDIERFAREPRGRAHARDLAALAALAQGHEGATAAFDARGPRCQRPKECH